MLTRIEALVSKNGAVPLPPIPTGVPPAVAAVGRFRDLFAGIYLRRTLSLWVLWFCTYGITYAMTGWLPSIMRTIYHLPVAQSNLYGFILNIVGLCVLLTAVFTIDRIGRKRRICRRLHARRRAAAHRDIGAELERLRTSRAGHARLRRDGHDPWLARHVYRRELSQSSARHRQWRHQRVAAHVVGDQPLSGRADPAGLRRRRRLRHVRACSPSSAASPARCSRSRPRARRSKSFRPPQLPPRRREAISLDHQQGPA